MNAKKIAAFAIGPVGSAVLSFIALPIIAWFYSVEEVGQISMLQVGVSFCILVFSLGLDQAYVREYHEAEQKTELLKATLLPGLFLLTLALSICFVVPVFISRVLFSVESVLVSALISLCILAAFISRFLSLILRMQERGMAYSMSQVLPKLLFLSVIGMYVIFSFGFDLLHLVIAHTISVVAVTCVYSWNTRREWQAAFKQKIDSNNVKLLLRFGGPLIIGGVAFWGATVMDKLFLRSVSTFEELGVYSVASSFAAVAVVFQSVFSTVWAPTVYKWAAEGVNVEKIDYVTECVLTAVVILFSLAGLFSWVVAYMLPENYDRVQYVLVACMAYPLFYTLSETTVVGIGIARKSVYAMIAAIIATFFGFAVNYILVPHYGASGAAISTGVAFWVFLFLRTEFSCRLWRPVPRVKLYSATLMCLVMAAAFSLKGHENHALFAGGWLSMLVVSCFLFKDVLNSAYVFLAKGKVSVIG